MARRVIGTVLLGGLLGVLIGSQVLFPQHFLPLPTGAHPIGTTVFTVRDDAREDVFAPGHRRTLTVQVWYPADPGARGPVEPYVRDRDALSGMLDYVGAPHWPLWYLATAPTHARTDAPVADGRFPVVVVLTGNLGYRQSQTVQVEDLASHGFVVVGLDQPGTVSSALLEDGRRIPYAGRRTVKPLVDQSLQAGATAPRLNGTPYPRGLLPYLAQDPAAVVERLRAGAVPERLRGHLDVDRLGVFGMSLGAATASQWCATDAAPRACLFVDGPMAADAVARGLRIPSLWLTRPRADMVAEKWPEHEIAWYDARSRELFARNPSPAWYVTLAGRLHADLTDAPYGSPVFAAAGLTSPGTGEETHEIMRRTTTAFFRRTLGGAAASETGELDAARWPGVEIIRHAGA